MRALVLSGGGAKGCFQVGVLRGMLNDNPDLDYDIYTGISVGAINVSQLASAPLDESLPGLEEIWLKDIKGNSSVWKHKLFPRLIWSVALMLALFAGTLTSLFLSGPLFLSIGLLLLFVLSLIVPNFIMKGTSSVYSTKPLRNLLNRKLPKDKIKTSGKKMRIGGVCYQDGKYYTADELSPNIVEWVMASSSFPVFFPMEKIDGKDFTDGGVREVAPVRDAVEMGADEIDVIITRPYDMSIKEEVGSVVTQLSHFIDIMSDEIIDNDLGIYSGCDYVKVRIIAPPTAVVENSLKFDPKEIKAGYEMGLKVASELT